MFSQFSFYISWYLRGCFSAQYYWVSNNWRVWQHKWLGGVLSKLWLRSDPDPAVWYLLLSGVCCCLVSVELALFWSLADLWGVALVSVAAFFNRLPCQPPWVGAMSPCLVHAPLTLLINILFTTSLARWKKNYGLKLSFNDEIICHAKICSVWCMCLM